MCCFSARPSSLLPVAFQPPPISQGKLQDGILTEEARRKHKWTIYVQWMFETPSGCDLCDVESTLWECLVAAWRVCCVSSTFSQRVPRIQCQPSTSFIRAFQSNSTLSHPCPPMRPEFVANGTAVNACFLLENRENSQKKRTFVTRPELFANV